MMVVGAEVPQPGPSEINHSIPFSIAKFTVTVSYIPMRYVEAIERQRINDAAKCGSREIIEEMKIGKTNL